MNRIALLILVAAAFLLGAGITYFNLFPSAYVESGLRAAGRIVGLEPPPVYTPPPRRFTNQRMQLAPDTSTQGTIKDAPISYDSAHLQAELIVLPGVFNPHEAEWVVLPIMQDHSALFAGKDVMEIGTGSGIISLYAAKLGANRVVATDINPTAIQTVTDNAAALGFANIVEPRLVPETDMSAYSVIEDGEKFDVIISNPPFALDLDADINDAVVDTGELGFSIVRGLQDHLKPGGVVILLYDSLFYHQVMVKFARYMGYDVRNHNPNGLYPWAAESLFNNYLARLLRAEGLPEDAFGFDYSTDEALQLPYIRNAGLRPRQLGFDPLFPPPAPDKYYAGMIVIERPGG